MLLQTPPEPLDFLYLLDLSVTIGILDALLARRLGRDLGWGAGLKSFYGRLFIAKGSYANAVLRVALALLIPVVYGAAFFVGEGGCVAEICLPREPLPYWDTLLWWPFLGWAIACGGLVLEDYVRYRWNRPHAPRSANASGKRLIIEVGRNFGVPILLIAAAVAIPSYWADPSAGEFAASVFGLAVALLFHQVVSTAPEPRAPPAPWERSPLERLDERRAAEILVLAILLVLLLNVGWTWSGTTVRQAVRVNASGVLTFSPATQLTAYAHDFDLAANASPGIAGYAPNVVASNIVPSFLFFDQPALDQRVVVSNGTQSVYDQVAPDFELDFLSTSSCGLIVLSQTPFEFSTILEAPLVLQLALPNFGRSPALTIYGYQGSTGISTNFAASGSSRGVANLKCENPAFTANGTRFSYPGSYFISVSGFMGLRGSVWLWEGSRFDLNGQWTLTTRDANVTMADGSGAAWTGAGEAEVVRGNATVLDASSFTVSHTEGPQGSGADTLTWSQQAGYAYVDTGSVRATLLGSSESFAPNVAEAALRWTVTDLCVLAGVAIILVIPRMPPDTRMKEGTSGPEPDAPPRHWVKAAAILVVVVLLGVLFLGFATEASLRDLSPPYFYSRFPTTLDIWYENGVNTGFASTAVRIFLWEAERFVGLHVVAISNHTFDGGNPRVYNLTDSDLWSPAGSIGLNRAEVWLGAPIPLRITFLTGSGKGFAGVNNFGTSIVVFPGMYSTTLNLVTTLLHEFGHALGFAHDSCSPMMTNDTATNVRLALSAYNLLELNTSYRGVYVNAEVLNGTFAGYPDWGSFVGRADNVSVGTWSNILRTTDSLTYFNPGNNSLHEVLWEQDLNETSGSMAYSSMVFTAPPNVFLISWSTAEQLYLEESLAGYPASSPPIGQC